MMHKLSENAKLAVYKALIESHIRYGASVWGTAAEIQVDFEGRNPIDSDFHGIKQLLQQLFLKAHINLSDLTDLIISQNYVGSVVKQSDIDEDSGDEDDDTSPNDVFGITTVVNLTDKQFKMECWMGEHCGYAVKSLVQTHHNFRWHLNIPCNQPVPSDNTIETSVNNLKLTGSMFKKRGGSVKIVRTPENIERLISSSRSVIQHATRLRLSDTSVRRIQQHIQFCEVMPVMRHTSAFPVFSVNKISRRRRKILYSFMKHLFTVRK
ncbi:hypothetical protein J6590_088580 [Homalodisca vitripennis]|nr:hypothetical protein J6590_088580 [Homalodisca vitripennis]